MKCYNQYTGEVQERPFAALPWIPVKDFSVNDEPSMTVPGQVESVKQIYTKCVRGDVASLNQLSVDDAQYGNYDDDPTEEPGFDLADVPGVMEQAQARAQAASVAKQKMEQMKSAVSATKSATKPVSAEAETKKE